MKGLYFKDFHVMKKSMRIVIPVCLGCLLLAVMMVLSMQYGNLRPEAMISISGGEITDIKSAIMISKLVISLVILMPGMFLIDMFSCFDSDEKAGFHKVLGFVPVSVKKVVLARYCALFTYMAGALLVSFAMIGILALFQSQIAPGELLLWVWVEVIVLVVFCSISFPLNYRMGNKGAQIAGIAVMILLGGLAARKMVDIVGLEEEEAMMAEIEKIGSEITTFLNQNVIWILLGLMALLVLSYFCSVKAYQMGRAKA